jgi:hypothetical protein
MDMDMSDMAGMDAGSDTQFLPGNRRLAHTYWYIVVGAVGFGLVLGVLRTVDTWRRSVPHPLPGLH